MFGGGEEFFREPEPIDRETLRRFAAFCANLRNSEKMGVKSIAETTDLAVSVGDSLVAVEMVVGVLFRHIKSWTGSKQLRCWYILDSLCKKSRDKYAFYAGKHIVEVAGDYIPFEDPSFSEKYERLIEHWDRVFPPDVIKTLWGCKKERLWAVANVGEVKRAREAEEAEWKREELRQQEEDGLDDYGQPCMDYLQGRCTWGANCKLLHPPGLENTLPLECRLGDWRCGSCGVINRHFRRRCSNCVKEKPQFRKLSNQSTEDSLLSNPDPAVSQLARRQFGFDPSSEEECLSYWERRFKFTNLAQYRNERFAAMRTRIFAREPKNELESRVKNQINFPVIEISAATNDVALVEPPAKRARVESLVPEGLNPLEGISFLSRVVVERGVHDLTVPQALFQITLLAKEISSAPSLQLNASQSDALLAACRLIYSAWNTSRSTTAFAEPFFVDLLPCVSQLGLPQPLQTQLSMICGSVEQHLKR